MLSFHDLFEDLKVLFDPFLILFYHSIISSLLIVAPSFSVSACFRIFSLYAVEFIYFSKLSLAGTFLPPCIPHSFAHFASPGSYWSP